MHMNMKLSDYLDRFSWSQAELSRQAYISPQCVARALKGEPITRRNADAIIEALQRKHRELGLKGVITLASVKDLHITPLRRKRKPAAADQPDQPDQGEGSAKRNEPE